MTPTPTRAVRDPVDACRASTLAALAQRATSPEPVESAIEYALEALRRQLAADAATYWDLPAPGRIRLAVASGWPQPIDGTVYPIAPDSQAAFVLRTPDVVVVDQLEDRRFVPSGLVTSMGFTTSVAHRVGTDPHPSGLISAHRCGQPFGSDDETFLAATAGIVSLAVEYQRSREDLRFRAEHDSLTGLVNRATLLAALDAVAGRTPPSAVLLLDLDGFKRVNDTSGHHAGDAVLQCIGRRLLDAVRSGDLVARLGGDEFVVLAPGCDAGEARSLAERAVGAIEQLITVRLETFSISASVGIADASLHHSGLALLQAADAAMYTAKALGRGRIHVSPAPAQPTAPAAAPEANPHAVDSTLTLEAIMDAIEHTTIVFQPIVTADDAAVVGVEALARGPAGTRFEQPAWFFAAAETFSRLAELDLAAKHAAFRSGIPDWLTLFVNVDPTVLTDDRCRAALLDSWSTSGFGGKVVIELTERSLVTSPGRLLRAIDSCREAGWLIALDDVGARAETLTALRLVRPDIAKLDLSLVDGRNRSHAASIAVALSAHQDRWPLAVVAEGVETSEHEDIARDLGATLLQGFRFGRPGPLAAAIGVAAGPGGDVSQPPPSPALLSWIARSTGRTKRTTTKRHLVDVTRVVEAMAGGPESIVLAALQSATSYTQQTRHQYRALARRCGIAGVLGVGIAPGVVNGVHHAPIPVGEPLAHQWIVVVLSADGAIALLAEETTPARDDLDRGFEYRVTRDPDEVEAVAHRLLAYF